MRIDAENNAYVPRIYYDCERGAADARHRGRRAFAVVVALVLSGCGGSKGATLPGLGSALPATVANRSSETNRGPLIRDFATRDSRLRSPFDLSFNRHGTLWFNTSSPHVGFMRTIGTFGSRNLPIKTSPAGPERADEMAQGPDGRVWFTDYYGGTLGTIDSAGHAKQYRVFNDGYSAGLVSGPNGHLWVMLTGGYSSLEEVDTSKKIPEVRHAFRLNGDYQETITVGSDGNLWVGGSGDYQVMTRVTPDGEITDFPVEVLDGVWGEALGPDGNVWFTGATDASYGRYVSKITPTGAITQYKIKSQGEGIVAGPDGNMWFTEPYEGIIGKITMQGVVAEYKIPKAIKNSSPNYQDTGIVVGPDGNLWFTEPMRSKIGEVILAK